MAGDERDLRDEPSSTAIPDTETSTAPSLQRPPHPHANASFFSRLFFLWPWPLLKLGLERPLTDADLADVLPEDTSAANLQYLQAIWDPNGGPHKSGLRRVLMRDFFRTTWFIQPLLVAVSVAKVLQAVCLGNLIESFEKNNANEGYYWAAGVVVCGLVFLLDFHHVFLITWRKAMHIRVACIASIYEKALRLSSTHQETLASNGRIMNLASNDVERFFMTCLFISFLIWSPLQAIGILIVGVVMVGPAFSAGVALLAIVFVPLQFYLSKRFAHFRSSIAALTDQRVTFVSQAVRGARVMKMSGYEERFLERIQALRQQEVNQLQAAIRLKAANETLYFVTNIVVTLVVFLVHVYTGGELKAGDVFAVFTLVNVMQLELTKYVSLAIMAGSECYVSVGRIQQFLEFAERPQLDATSSQQEDEDEKREETNVAISLRNVTCRWDDVKQVRGSSISNNNKDDAALTESESSAVLPPAIVDATVDFSHGSLTAVVGPVGSGKSALLQALVKELAVRSGSIRRNYNTLAYASQDPWIMDGTIQENIVMGMDYDKDWYAEVVRACSLGLDFAQLRDGDQAVVGDRGVQLSGGQRARIGLARAIYKNADVLVADDPLSAVDARVGRHLFQNAILGLSVNKGKCVVLATHQHQYINDTQCLLIMSGRVKCIGSYSDCVAASEGKLTAHDADTDNSATEQAQPAVETAEQADRPEGDEMVGKQEKKSEQDEKNAQGVVQMDTYVQYVLALGGLLVFVAVIFLYVCTQGAVLVTAAMMGRWAERDAEEQTDADIIATVLSLSALVVLLASIRAFISLELTLKASQVLHDRMAAAVLRAKIEFFDTNPLGRILNRFSADVGIADDLLPNTLLDLFSLSFIVLGAVITALTTLPFALAVLPFLIWYFVRVRRIFVTSTRELKRLEGIARSPVFAMLSEALGGIATIRANDYIGYFRKKFQTAHDAHTRTFFAFIAASRWIGFRMDSIVFVFLSVVSFLSVLVQSEGWFDIDPSVLGLALSMLISLSGVFQWCIRQSAEVVNQMVSVERVVEFGRLQSEAELHRDNDKGLESSGWPSAGEVEYDGVSVRYRASLPLALRRISFRIPAGARVGVVGRTGSGKSTVVQSLFRLLEPEEGRILVDGKDVAEMGLHALRTKISVIPQVPTLFSGCTVRENLDLFKLHSEDEIRAVLEACHLKAVIEDLPNGWDSVVSEGGSNFSVGQRQLLCLARAILSKNKILVLDEATASVDRRTDQLLQQTLQESYNDGTILAVAHRLDTIIDYDLVLVLGQGEVLEFGSPAELLADEAGVFSQMVNDTGDAMAKSLREKAGSPREKSN